MAEESAPRYPLKGMSFTGPELTENEVVVDALCVTRVQSMDNGRSRVIVFRSDGIDDVTETGMLTVAALKDRMAWENVYGGDDDGDD